MPGSSVGRMRARCIHVRICDLAFSVSCSSVTGVVALERLYATRSSRVKVCGRSYIFDLFMVEANSNLLLCCFAHFLSEFDE